MVTDNTFWKARTYLNHGLVKLIGSHHGHLEFEVHGHTVFKNPIIQSWSCCAASKGKNRIRTGCILFGKGKDCSHILAAKMWLRADDLKLEVKNNEMSDVF